MSPFVFGIFCLFVLFLIVCGICGYRRRWVGFASIIVSSWTINFTWMALAAGVEPLSGNALTAQGALALYGFCGFATGWMISRIIRKLRETAVEP
jgi:hypothetical protein